MEFEGEFYCKYQTDGGISLFELTSVLVSLLLLLHGAGEAVHPAGPLDVQQAHAHGPQEDSQQPGVLY